MHYTVEWILIIILSLYLILSFFKNKCTNAKIINFVFLGFGLLYIILLLRLQDNTTFDLSRHIDDIKYLESLPFFDSLKVIFSKANFLWFFYLYLMHFIPIHNILPIITIIICFLIYYFIVLKNNDDIKCKILSIFILLSIINPTHIMSGIRNYFAISIFSLGIFLVNKKNKLGHLLCFLSLFIHPMTIIFIVFYYFNFIFKKMKYLKIGLIFWKPLCYLIVFIVGLIPLSLFKLYYEKLYNELTINFGFDYRVFIFELLQIGLLTYYLYKNKNKDNKLSSTLDYLNYFVIGSITMQNIFIRVRFLLGFNFKNIYYDNKKMNNVLLIVSFIIFVYYNYYMMMNGTYG